MLCFSSLLLYTPSYVPEARRLFDALDSQHVKYSLLDGTKDIWLRDFMPVRTKSGKCVSFRYEPSYLADKPGFARIFGAISPSVFSENPDVSRFALVGELELLLDARVIIIPSLASDCTGHADEMVRFLDEHTVLGNGTPYQNGLEQKIARTSKSNGIDTLDFPYFASPKDSAVGCYLNFLETKKAIFLPVFGVPEEENTVKRATKLFSKPVVLNEIAKEGGCLN